MIELTSKQIQELKNYDKDPQLMCWEDLDLKNLSDAELRQAKKTIINQLKAEARVYERVVMRLRASRNVFEAEIKKQLESNKHDRWYKEVMGE